MHLMQFAALFAVLGHMFPLWLRFRGGKGVATALGAYLAINPFSVVGALTVFIIVVAVSKYVSLGSIIASAVFPVMLFERYDPKAIWPAALVSLLIILKHHENIRRLLSGTEDKFGEKNPPAPPDAVEKQA